MRIRTLVRTSSALVTLPLGIGLAVLYYLTDTQGQIAFFPYPYAPLLMERPLEPMYAVTYALVSAAAAWQGARLKESGLWNVAPYRRTWQIILTALSPIVALGWLMFLGPVIMAFVQTPTWPDVNGLPPLLLGMSLVVAHAVIGFTIGQKVKPLIAAPTLLCLVFIVVTFSHAVEPDYLRYMMGQYTAALGFGETATLPSMASDMLPTAGLGVAAALLWMNVRIVLRVVLAVAVVFGSTYSSYLIARDWKATPPIHVATEKVCRGSVPRVCVPAVASKSLDDVRGKMTQTYAMLERFGVIEHAPSTVNDQLLYGRFTQDPTPTTRYLPLSVSYQRGRLVADVVNDSVRFSCDAPKLVEERSIGFWLSKKLSTNPSFAEVSAQDPYFTRDQYDKVVQEIQRISSLSVPDQKSWYRSTMKKACEGRP